MATRSSGTGVWPMAFLLLLCLLSPAVSQPGTRHIHIQLLPRGYKAPANATSVLDCPANPDKIISIVLKPRTINSTSANSTDKDGIVDNNSLCGLDESIDPERLLSEWNSPYIFELLNKKDPNSLYTTQVYEVCSFTTSGDLMTTTTSTTTSRKTSTITSATTSITTLTAKSTTTSTKAKSTTRTSAQLEGNSDETGNSPTLGTDLTKTPEASYEELALYSLFVAPPTSDCNAASLEAAVKGEDGFLPVFIGLSSDFLPQKEMFLNDVECLKSGFKGIKPKLCATKLYMPRQQSESRISTLTQIFNFPYVEGRQLIIRTLKQCNSRRSTEKTIHKSSFFDTTSPMKFKLERKIAYEADGFVKIEIHRYSNSTEKMVGNLKTSIGPEGNSATQEDFTSYDGPVVFKKDMSVTEAIIGIKKDNVSEADEEFMASLNNISSRKRKKRSTAPLHLTIAHGFWPGALIHGCPLDRVPDPSSAISVVNAAGVPQHVYNCIDANNFLAEFDNAHEIGPFRERSATGNNLRRPRFLIVTPAHRTHYKSTYDSRLNIPIRAVITLDHSVRPAPAPAPIWTSLPRPNPFETDLRERVRPREWFNSDTRSPSLNFCALPPVSQCPPRWPSVPQTPRVDAFMDYTLDTKYRNQNPPIYQRGHLVSSNIFRTLFKKERDNNLSDIVFDYATYLTNVFPQKDAGSNWQQEENTEFEAAKHCLMRDQTRPGHPAVPNKFHIIKGTIPSGPGPWDPTQVLLTRARPYDSEKFMQNTNFLDFTGFGGFTNVNIPRYIYMAYCCSTHYATHPAKFTIFEHHVEGVNGPGDPAVVHGHSPVTGVNNDRIHRSWSGTGDMFDGLNVRNDPTVTGYQMLEEFRQELERLWREEHPIGSVYEDPKLFNLPNLSPCGTQGQIYGSTDVASDFDFTPVP